MARFVFEDELNQQSAPEMGRFVFEDEVVHQGPPITDLKDNPTQGDLGELVKAGAKDVLAEANIAKAGLASSVERGLETGPTARLNLNDLIDHGQKQPFSPSKGFGISTVSGLPVDRHGRQLVGFDTEALQQTPESRDASVSVKKSLQKTLSDTRKRALREASRLIKESSKAKYSPTVERALQTQKLPDAINAVMQDPVRFVLEVSARSAAPSLAALASGAAGAAAGPAGFAVGLGAGSGIMDFAGEVLGGLQEHGVDVTDPSAIERALNDHKLMNEIARKSAVHAAFVGTIDGLTGGVASKFLAPEKLKGSIAGELANIASQSAVQMAGGAGGEYLGSKAAGKDVGAGELLAEGLGELATVPVDVLTARGSARMRAAEAKAQGETGSANRFVFEDELQQAKAEVDDLAEQFESATAKDEAPADSPTPEPKTTVQAQIDAFVEGRKPAVLITPGSPMPEIPEDAMVADIPEGKLIYRDVSALRDALDGKLGDVLGYGIEAKPETDTVVTARDKHGRVVQDVATDDRPEVVQAAKVAAGEGGTVEQRPVNDALAEREATKAREWKAEVVSTNPEEIRKEPERNAPQVQQPQQPVELTPEDEELRKQADRSARATKAARKRMQPNWEKDDIDRFLRKMGGISSSESDFRSHFSEKEIESRGNKFYGPLVRKNGMSADKAAQAAYEAGYIDEATPDALYAALEKHHIQGIPVYTPAGYQRIEQEKMRKAEIEAKLAEEQDKKDFGEDWELRAVDSDTRLEDAERWIVQNDSLDPIALFTDDGGSQAIAGQKSRLISLDDLAAIDEEIARYEQQQAEHDTGRTAQELRGLQAEGNRQGEAAESEGGVSGRERVRLPQEETERLTLAPTESSRPKQSKKAKQDRLFDLGQAETPDTMTPGGEAKIEPGSLLDVQGREAEKRQQKIPGTEQVAKVKNDRAADLKLQARQDSDKPAGLKLTFEEFLARKGISRTPPSFPELHRKPGRVSKASEKAADRRVMAAMNEWQRAVDQARDEYKKAVERGEITPPTSTEELEHIASSSGQRAEAARRVLEKRKKAKAVAQNQTTVTKQKVALHAGDVFTTVTGRQTTPFPKLSGKPRMAKRDEIKVREWLKENAIAEAKARGDDFNLTQWNMLDTRNWSPADGDLVNLYLFDDPDGYIGSRKKTKETEKGIEIYEPENITYTAKAGGVYEVQDRKGKDDHTGRGGTARESGDVEGNVHAGPGIQRVALRRTGTVATATTTVKSPADAAHVMAALRKEPQENIAAIVLDKNDKIVSIIHHSVGGRASAPIESMSLAGAIASIDDAASAYLVHNHPSNSAALSKEDEAVYARINRLLHASGIRLKDMLAVTADGRYASIADKDQKIHPRARTKRVKIVSRRFIATKSGMEISNPIDLQRAIRKYAKGKTGVLIVNHANRVTGFLPLSVDEMKALSNTRLGKTKTAARELLAAMHEGNASALFPVVSDMKHDVDAIRNIIRFSNASSVKVHDAMDLNGISGRMESVDVGRVILGETSDNFYSKGKKHGVVVELTGDEVTSLDENPARAAVLYYKGHLQGKPAHVKLKGDRYPREVRFSDVGKSKIRHGAHRDMLKVKLVAAIRDIIEKGEFSEPEQAHKPGAKYPIYHRVRGTVDIGGTKVVAEVILAEDKHGRLFYHLGYDDTGYKERPFKEPGDDRGLNDLKRSVAQSNLNINIIDVESGLSTKQAENLLIKTFGPAMRRALRLGRVVIHRTDADVPGSVKRMVAWHGSPHDFDSEDIEVIAKFSRDGAVQGWTDANGTIHIVASNNSEETLPATLLHESLHNFFHKDGKAKDRAIRQLRQARKLAGKRGIVHDWFKKADKWIVNAEFAVPGDTPDAHYDEEVLAYAVTHYETAPRTIRSIVDRLLGELRAFLIRKFGIDMKITPATLRALARQNLGTLGRESGFVLDGAQVQFSKAKKQVRYPGRAKTLEANISRGKRAMQRVINERIDVLNAMYRDDIGEVSFYYGEPGNPEKNFQGGHGVAKIIAKRDSEGVDGKAVALKMVEVIALGKVGSVYGPKGGERVNIHYDGYTAVLSRYRHGKNETWLLTGWSDVASDGSAGVNPNDPYAHHPSGIQDGVGAEAKSLQATKSVDKNDENIKFSRAHDDRDLKSLLGKIGKQHKPFRDRIKDAFDNAGARFIQANLDQFHALKLAEQQLGLITDKGEIKNFDESAYVAARMSTSTDSQLMVAMERGHLVWEKLDGGGKVASFAKDSKGLLEILQPVADRIQEWEAYMVARRAARLYIEGRERLLTPAEIRAGLELGKRHPEFEKVAKEWAAFNKAMLDFAEEAGLIDPEGRKLWEHADYIPFNRIIEERDSVSGPKAKKGLANQSSGIRKLKGGTSNINDVLENMIMNTAHLIEASMKNHAARMAVQNLKKLGLVSKAGLQMKPALIPDSAVRKMLKEEGVDLSAVGADVIQGIKKMWSLQRPTDPDVIRVMENGRPVYYRVHDRMLYNALASINANEFGRWMQLFSVPKRWLTTGVTITPGFQLANFTRDTLQAFVVSRDRLRPVVSAFKGAAKTLVNHDQYWGFLASGGGFHNGYINAHDPSKTAKVIKAEMRKKGFKAGLIDSPKRALDRWMDISNAIENANRLAVYDAAIQSGRGKLAAAYEGKDLMDFSMTGSGVIYRFLAQTVPFFNARVQGLYRLVRGAHENPRAFMIKGSMIMLAAIAYTLFNADDDRYKDLSEEDKDLYWHFWTGKGEDALHIRIPKPFEVGFIFGTIPERFIEAMYSKESDAGKRFLKRMAWNIKNVFEMNPIPQTVKPVSEIWADIDTFTGRPIVGIANQDKIAAYQYTPFTHKSMIALGRETGLSPAQVEHLIGAYFGPLGDFAMTMADMVVEGLWDFPATPAWRIDDYPVIGRFVKQSPPRSSRYAQEFWELFKDARDAYNTVLALRREGDVETARELVDDRMNDIIGYRIGNRFYQAVKKVNKQIRMVHVSRTMTPEEKRRRIDELTKVKLTLYKRAVKAMKTARSD